ncbi:16S rRNA (guanine(966)-N(2))-methyltransferase RsmD [Propionibacteriaceae bacterium G1746]|uniref:16S rRNA (guanine(966)-N(2))-methyltransferase RsmD n=1 Tax=Aestuariimicrobium sp. G57 TaxID=3418485 RepID=UPI003C15BF53
MSRIVAGRAGGRRLETPAGANTRPTTDRVREAFFSVLASWNGTGDRAADDQLAGLSFLDLYAGSGAVGLEAASRGARPVLLVEQDGRTHDLIRRNIATTGLPATSRAARAETLVAARNPDPAYDVVWLDPPYGLAVESINPILANIVANGWVRDDGVIILERSGRGDAPDLPGAESWSRRYGETTLFWFAPDGEAGGGDGNAADATHDNPAGSPAGQEEL